MTIIKSNFPSYILNNSDKKVFIICDKTVNIKEFFAKMQQVQLKFDTLTIPDLKVPTINEVNFGSISSPSFSSSMINSISIPTINDENFEEIDVKCPKFEDFDEINFSKKTGWGLFD